MVVEKSSHDSFKPSDILKPDHSKMDLIFVSMKSTLSRSFVLKNKNPAQANEIYMIKKMVNNSRAQLVIYEGSFAICDDFETKTNSAFTT